MSKGVILLCAGGTGGHLFPAEAVAHELKARGYAIHLAADDRVQRFASNFPAEEIHTVKSATFGSKNPLALARALMQLGSGYLQSHSLINRLKPSAVAGFGGYPTVPPVLAATRKKIPTLVHESNAVLGRANRFLSSRVSKVAIGFENPSTGSAKGAIVTGNPVRAPILEAAKADYPPRDVNGPFNLLVFGGSQGASFFSEAIPQALALLPREKLQRLHLTQQAREEDRESLEAAFRHLSVRADVATFFPNMAELLGASHLVISRAGASTVSELSVIGRPAILVPYPHALDHDQAGNAATMANAQGARLCKQSDLKPEVLAALLEEAIDAPKMLAQQAKNAKKTGKPDATTVLADMLEALAVA